MALRLRRTERGSGSGGVDTYDSAPEYFGKRSKKEKAAVAVRPERWEALLAPGQSIEALRATWSEQRTFAEDTLRKTAQHFGLDVERASIGYEYADKTNAKYVRLALRHARRPASERRAVGPTVEGGMAALAGLPTKRMLAAMYASVVHANIEARGGAPGRGTLFASFVPLGNPQGALTHEMAIDARPTPVGRSAPPRTSKRMSCGRWTAPCCLRRSRWT